MIFFGGYGYVTSALIANLNRYKRNGTAYPFQQDEVTAVINRWAKNAVKKSKLQTVHHSCCCRCRASRFVFSSAQTPLSGAAPPIASCAKFLSCVSRWRLSRVRALPSYFLGDEKRFKADDRGAFRKRSEEASVEEMGGAAPPPSFLWRLQHRAQQICSAALPV